MKRALIFAVCILVVLSLAGCGKKDENSQNSGDTTAVTDSANAVDENKSPEGEDAKIGEEGQAVEGDIEEGIEFGGDIDDEGNVIVEENPQLPTESNSQATNPERQDLNTEINITYDENGNITTESAILILQKYTAEQLGLSDGVEHQLLFDEEGTDVDGKKCYAIVAKIAGGNTEGVFYVAYDGSVAYKYDISTQKYIKLP